MQVSSPLAHLHLLGSQFHLCKPHPASVWLIPLWSISGRHHRYCWSPHCTAKQFQILSVGIEKSIDIFGKWSNYVHNEHFNPLFSVCHLCTPFYWSSFWANWFFPDVVKAWTFGQLQKKKKKGSHPFNFISLLHNKGTQSTGDCTRQSDFEDRNDDNSQLG